MSLQIVILAAGLGKRMHSTKPKAMNALGGIPLLAHVLKTSKQLLQNQSEPMVVVGHQAGSIQKAFGNEHITFVTQNEPRGTGHALQQALPHFQDEALILVLYGDVPLITAQTLKRLIDGTDADGVGILLQHLENPTGYGRIIRDKNGHVQNIVEEKDCQGDQAAIQEINTGIGCFSARRLKEWLPQIKPHNAQNEYYLTDLIAIAYQNGVRIHTTYADCEEEAAGVNTPEQLARLERYYQKEQAKYWLAKGVTILDPMRFDVRGGPIHIGKDVTIDVNVILEGDVTIDDGCHIGANCVLKNARLGKNVRVQPFTLIEGSNVGDASVIGPYARLRPDNQLGDGVHVGNFVEVKNSRVRNHSKINHLSYLGDSEVGSEVNIGAGTITCNYDGAQKHKTTIGDRVHIGSGSLLVAPVTIGKGATLGAGSVITKDTPEEQLTLTHRLEQRSIATWKRPQKSEETNQ